MGMAPVVQKQNRENKNRGFGTTTGIHPDGAMPNPGRWDC